MKVLDKPIMAVMRWSRRRRRSKELQAAIPGLEGSALPDRPAQAHTAAHVAAGGKLARPKSLKVALAAVVVAGTVGVPAYLAGSTVAGAEASEESEQAAYDEALADYEAAQSREAAALQAAVAAYSSEREAAGETLPEQEAIQNLTAEHDISEMEAREVVAGESVAAGLENAIGQSHVTAEAERMWTEEPPYGEVARERVQAYEAASEEAEAEQQDYEVALDRAIDE